MQKLIVFRSGILDVFVAINDGRIRNRAFPPMQGLKKELGHETDGLMVVWDGRNAAGM